MRAFEVSGGQIKEVCLKCLSVEQEFEHIVPGVGVYRWRISKAIEIVNATPDRERILIPHEVKRSILVNNEFDPWHVQHVSLDKPGILAQVFNPGTNEIQYALIDGTHRCARSVIESKPFYCVMLTHKEAIQCCIEFPRHSPRVLAMMEQDAALRDVRPIDELREVKV